MLQPFPAALRIVNTVSTVLGAQDSLESINTEILMDRALVSCAANNFIYQLRKDSVAAPSLPDIVAPVAGPGRWVRYQTSSGGGIDPLTAEFFVDPGRLDSTEDGSIAEPFLTPQAAIDHGIALLLSSFTVILCPGNYTALSISVLSPEAGGPSDLTIIGMGGSSPIGRGVPMVSLNDININNGTEGGPFSTTLQDLQCQTLEAFGNVVLRRVYPVASTIGISANAVIDESDLYQLRQFGANTPSTGIKPVNTGLGVVYAVPALTATFADVTVDVSGSPAFVDLRVGDVIKVTTTTRLANVGIVDAFCDVAGQLTLRFFGTTAGGNVTVNFSISPMSA
jgi:hypothetical protein